MFNAKRARLLMMIGLAAMLLAALDPMEGSIVIVIGAGLATVGGMIGQTRRRGLLVWSLALLAVGVGFLFGLSAIGGFGGNSGRSYWWGLTLLPYPVGWILGIVACMKDLFAKQTPASA